LGGRNHGRFFLIPAFLFIYKNNYQNQNRYFNYKMFRSTFIPEIFKYSFDQY